MRGYRVGIILDWLCYWEWFGYDISVHKYKKGVNI
jgi:hypothetical protein